MGENQFFFLSFILLKYGFLAIFPIHINRACTIKGKLTIVRTSTQRSVFCFHFSNTYLLLILIAFFSPLLFPQFHSQYNTLFFLFFCNKQWMKMSIRFIRVYWYTLMQHTVQFGMLFFVVQFEWWSLPINNAELDGRRMS